VIDLVDHGVEELHFYTMNRADLVFAICHLVGLRATPAPLAIPTVRRDPPPLAVGASG
jgi:methylenetetrahydrofolate reductase (NADPH)